MNKIIFKTIIFLGLMFPATTFAGVVDITINPEIPRPNQTISARLSGVLVDLDQSDIYWYLDDEIQKHGVGEKNFSFTSGEVDEKTVLDVIVMIPDGRRIDLQRTIAPMEVDLLWETDTYTPPFYRGKALPTYKSSIKVVAILNSKNTDIKFIYTWSIDDLNPIVGAAGYNRTKFVTAGSYAGYNRSVNVSMVSFDKSKKVKNEIKIRSVAPELILYENNSLRGTLLNKALHKTEEIMENEFSIKAEPYFMTTGEMKNVKYDWAINNVKIESEDARDKVITFIKPGDGSGKAFLQAYTKNMANTYQETEVVGVSLSY